MKKLLLLLALLAFSTNAFAQVPSPTLSQPVQMVPAYYATIPISVTATLNTQTTLSIPAPASNLYNYVCTLAFNASQNGTATANSNAVTTSTNFNSFALKFSLPATANLSYDWGISWGEPATGCAKSSSPGTATTFVSPAATAQTHFTWYATYYQAP